MEGKKCPKCNTLNISKANFCMKCRYSFKSSETTELEGKTGTEASQGEEATTEERGEATQREESVSPEGEVPIQTEPVTIEEPMTLEEPTTEERGEATQREKPPASEVEEPTPTLEEPTIEERGETAQREKASTSEVEKPTPILEEPPTLEEPMTLEEPTTEEREEVTQIEEPPTPEVEVPTPTLEEPTIEERGKATQIEESMTSEDEAPIPALEEPVIIEESITLEEPTMEERVEVSQIEEPSTSEGEEPTPTLEEPTTEEKEEADQKEEPPASEDEMPSQAPEMPPTPKMEEEQPKLEAPEVGEERQKRPSFYRQIGLTFLSIILTIIFQKFIATSFGYGSFLRRLFLPAGEWYQRAVPSIILLLFIWSLLDLFLKLKRIFLVDNRHLRHSDIINLPYTIKTKDVSLVLKNLSYLKLKIRRGNVFQRIFSLLKHLDSTNDVQRTHELFRYQSDIASDKATSGYTAVRMFIWAMPILGFIGTVMGITLAVGNFSGFLTTEIEYDQLAQLVKTKLSEVASGLSFAFDTTLLGLVASLFTMLITSFVQKSEESFLTELETLGLGILANFSVESKVKASKSIDELIDEFNKTVKDKIEKLTTNAEKFADAFKEALKGLSGDFTKYTDDLIKQMSAAAGGLLGSLEILTREFITVSQNVSKEFTEIPPLMRKNTGAFTEVVGGLSGSIEGLKTSFEEITQKTTGFKTTTQNLSEKLSELSQMIQENEGVIQSNFQEFDQKLQESTDHIKESSNVLAEKVDPLLAIQAVDALNTFSQLLENMQNTQNEVIRLLTRLSGPLEVRLVTSQQSDVGSQTPEVSQSQE